MAIRPPQRALASPGKRYLISIRSLDAETGASPPVLVIAESREEAIERFFDASVRLWDMYPRAGATSPFDRDRWEVVFCEEVTTTAPPKRRQARKPRPRRMA